MLRDTRSRLRLGIGLYLEPARLWRSLGYFESGLKAIATFVLLHGSIDLILLAGFVIGLVPAVKACRNALTDGLTGKPVEQPRSCRVWRVSLLLLLVRQPEHR